MSGRLLAHLAPLGIMIEDVLAFIRDPSAQSGHLREILNGVLQGTDPALVHDVAQLFARLGLSEAPYTSAAIRYGMKSPQLGEQIPQPAATVSLRLVQDQAAAFVRINRPSTNATQFANTLQGLTENLAQVSLAQANNRPGIDTIVIENLENLSWSMAQAPETERLRLYAAGINLVDTIATLQGPVIAVANGPIHGFALDLLMAVNQAPFGSVLVRNQSRIEFYSKTVGLQPDCGAFRYFSTLIDPGMALYLWGNHKGLTGQEALGLGLAHYVYSGQGYDTALTHTLEARETQRGEVAMTRFLFDAARGPETTTSRYGVMELIAKQGPGIVLNLITHLEHASQDPLRDQGFSAPQLKDFVMQTEALWNAIERASEAYRREPISPGDGLAGLPSINYWSESGHDHQRVVHDHGALELLARTPRLVERFGRQGLLTFYEAFLREDAQTTADYDGAEAKLRTQLQGLRVPATMRRYGPIIVIDFDREHTITSRRMAAFAQTIQTKLSQFAGIGRVILSYQGTEGEVERMDLIHRPNYQDYVQWRPHDLLRTLHKIDGAATIFGLSPLEKMQLRRFEAHARKLLVRSAYAPGLEEAQAFLEAIWLHDDIAALLEGLYKKAPRYSSRLQRVIERAHQQFQDYQQGAIAAHLYWTLSRPLGSHVAPSIDYKQIQAIVEAAELSLECLERASNFQRERAAYFLRLYALFHFNGLALSDAQRQLLSSLLNTIAATAPPSGALKESLQAAAHLVKNNFQLSKPTTTGGRGGPSGNGTPDQGSTPTIAISDTGDPDTPPVLMIHESSADPGQSLMIQARGSDGSATDHTSPSLPGSTAGAQVRKGPLEAGRLVRSAAMARHARHVML